MNSKSMARIVSFAAALAVSALCAPARADTGRGDRLSPLLDERLSDADAFKRFADRSREHAGAVSVEQWVEQQKSYALPGALCPGAEASPPSRTPPPSPRARRPARSSPSGRRPLVWGLAATGAAALGLGLLLMDGRPSSPPPAPPAAPGGIQIAGRTAPIRGPAPGPVPELPPPGPEPPSPPGPAVHFAPPPPELLPPGTRPQAWWAITAAEQHAIECWNEFAEGMEEFQALDDWLAANAGRFPEVDVSLLKAKLWRDV